MSQAVSMKPIKGFPGYYAGRDGQVYSTWNTGIFAAPDSRHPSPLKSSPRGNGYLGVVLARVGSTPISKNVSPLICGAWNGERVPGTEVSHKNGNNQDDRPDNLEWDTRPGNLSRRLIHGTDDRGVKNSRSSLNESSLRAIFELRSQGKTMASIASILGVSRPGVSRVLNGKRYQREVREMGLSVC